CLVTTKEARLMPSILKAVRLRNVRCFRDADVPLAPGVTVVIGGNDCGKTTLLEAIASLAPGGSEGLQQMPLRRKSKTGEVVLNGTNARWRVSSGSPALHESRQRLPRDTHVFIYGRYRRVYTQMDDDTGRASDPLTLLDQLLSRADKDCTT